MSQDASKTNDSKNGSTVIEALLTGSASSAITTVIYQPLELLKTRLQLRQSSQINKHNDNKLFGRAVKSAKQLTSVHGIGYLWRGTGASLLRSIPGVGLYYGSLTALQRNFSSHGNSPNNASQAFCFGLTARSVVSVILLPITVIKVRYESGFFKYESLASAVRDSYSRSGWVGLAPTLLRDSLFSGIYYMIYTQLKTYVRVHNEQSSSKESNHHVILNHFACGILSGLIASVLTNPIDVVKTHMQTENKNRTMQLTIRRLIHEEGGGLARFFDGLTLRSFRRTLIAATTWTLYEYFQDSINLKKAEANKRTTTAGTH